ncbi:MAG: imidazole glycerol phosphate synthase subunit HisH [Chloroherpetonaceae bacterium]|nr:imidazole glycerol phosphate synthase subunit HisH [Chloroherpetonaceae bacterium]MDW8437171.1 imidazole glycerol phosphate synthase subunit HisH [Chloroherpetonaceae bacterium]
MILILDYGAGNLRSVQKAFERLGAPAKISDDARDVARADKLVLPGVGAFGQGMQALRARGLDRAIGEHLAEGKMLLGVCLGMQLLLSESEEMGLHQGLNLISGKVRRFDAKKDKVPQIGWNRVGEIRRESALFKGIDEGTHFYFVHSYYCEAEDENATSARAFYAGENFAAAIEKNGIFAVQFHPEKSGTMGLKVLENFAKL